MSYSLPNIDFYRIANNTVYFPLMIMTTNSLTKLSTNAVPKNYLGFNKNYKDTLQVKLQALTKYQN